MVQGRLFLIRHRGRFENTGFRVKALVADETGAYLAKFASARNQVDVVGLEAAAMELARKAGIETADTILIALSTTI